MSDDRRIQQFKQMAEADPDNELGHFSLGRAYMETGQFDKAVPCFARVIDLKPKMSKAYQLLGEACDRAGDRKRAIETLVRGVTIADEQGDRMPRDAMADLLRSWGQTVPAFKNTPSGPAPVATGVSRAGFACIRCGRPSGQLAKTPFKGDLGARIFEHVCVTCWKEWIPMGTKVINELGLQLNTKHGQETYDQYMIEFLQLENV